MASHLVDEPQIEQLFVSALEAQKRGNDQQAERQFEQILQLRPGHPGALNSLGMRALARDDLEAAERLFSQAAQSDSQAPALWLNLATARRRRGDDEGERSALTSVLEIDQRHLMAHIRLAELHERLGEIPQAVRRWSGVLAIARLMPEIPPGLEALLAHAQAYVAQQNQAFGEVVDGGLEQARSRLDGRDRRRFDACVDAILGRRIIYHNICSGLHFPFLPADEFFDRSHFPWLEEIEAQTEAIRGELEALLTPGLDGFRPYVAMDSGTPTNKWSGLDNSLDWGAFFLWHHGRRDDEACARCPITAEALERIPRAEMANRAPTAFFSILRPHTRLPAHTGVSNARTIVHLPLIVPEGCGFRVGGETREWRVGEAFAFDDTIEHEAWNESNELRAVLIFDVWNPHLTEVERGLLQTFFRVADESGFNPGQGGDVSD
ncbi:MAG TPA: aspartyl/asparaginyl beta-hydroxylase domain-containing protein [Allosphingosinicella sp.]|nr:aspartyl/asparaginyl beta-hydroxylase domain-containing protein [Allosphingosinicella sp.]